MLVLVFLFPCCLLFIVPLFSQMAGFYLSLSLSLLPVAPCRCSGWFALIRLQGRDFSLPDFGYAKEGRQAVV